eukprot:1161502-Pelagomonas_calceolata.AAC.7
MLRTSLFSTPPPATGVMGQAALVLQVLHLAAEECSYKITIAWAASRPKGTFAVALVRLQTALITPWLSIDVPKTPWTTSPEMN